MSSIAAEQISRHVPRMFRVACRMLADADRADDVVQDACVKALAKIETFNGDAALASWLHRITINCAKDSMRSRDRKNAAHEGLSRNSTGERVAPCPAALAETLELSGLAWKMVQALPDECRSAFELTQLDGYSYDEAAAIENEARGTIASRVFRARKILQEQMNAHIHGRADA
jgi:RNA polymerase sigma-70 factor (ECF subfamily)